MTSRARRLLPLLLVLAFAAAPAFAANTYPLFARIFVKVTNLVLQSNQLDGDFWEKEATVAVAGALPSCPLDPNTGERMMLVSSSTAGNGIKQDVVSSPMRSLYLAYPDDGLACGLSVSDYSGDNAARYTTTGSAVRVTGGVAGDTGIKVAPVDPVTVVNYARYSEQIEQWTQSGTIGVVEDQGVFIDGQVKMDRLTPATAAAFRWRATGTLSFSSLVHSAWFRPEGGSHVGSIGIVCGGGGSTITSCTCGRDDGGTATAVVVLEGGIAAHCVCYGSFSDIGRMWAKAGCDSKDFGRVSLGAGQIGTSTDTILACGAQAEGDVAVPQDYCGPTTTTTATCVGTTPACPTWCMSSVQLENKTSVSSRFCGPTDVASLTCKFAP